MSKTIDRPSEAPASLPESLAGALDEGVNGALASLPPWLTEPLDAYPVQVSFRTPPEANRFWAIPLIGFLVKAVVLIPHFVFLTALTTVAVLAQLVLWVPVFITGEYPEWGYSLVRGTIRWWVRVEAYFLGLTDEYPPFSLEAQSGVYPVEVTIPRQPAYNRAWAIPVAGLLLKAVLLIPHLIVLRVLDIVVGVLQLVLWIPVLSRGQYPPWGSRLVGGYLRWSTRVTCYLVGLTDEYPPFNLG